MHINLILGFVALALFWGLVHCLRAWGGGKDRAALHEAGAMLSQELEARREAERLRRDFLERLEGIGRRKLEAVADALARMREAMPEAERERIAWELDGRTLRISILPGGTGTEREQAEGALKPQRVLQVLTIRWNIPNLDLADAAASERRLENLGIYGVSAMDGPEEPFASLAELIRYLARFVANALA